MSDELNPDVTPVDAPVEVAPDAPVEDVPVVDEPADAPVEPQDAPQDDVEPAADEPVADATVTFVEPVAVLLEVSNHLADLAAQIANIIANSPVPTAEISQLVIPATDASPELPL
jgi:hypothetical protein